MKKSVLILCMVLIGVQFPMRVGRTGDSAQVVVYYFHGQYRCTSCVRLEKLTKKAVASKFSREIARGDVMFRSINIDDTKNAHFLSDYRLSAKSVVLSKVVRGREVKWKNLLRILDYLKDEKMYVKYIRDEVLGLMAR